MKNPSLTLIPALSFAALAASAPAGPIPAANGLQRTLVAEQPLLKNPVSVSIDVDGAIYVTETTRRKAADLDIRQFVPYGWVLEDLKLNTVGDKLAFYRRELDGKKKFPKTDLADHNNDGVVDIKDLTALSEVIVRLTDENGDGLADRSTVFADGFNTEVTGIAAGTLARRGDVYATIAPDLWKLRDTDSDGVADVRESLVHGFGIHIAYAGHDMHGLTFGPDGRLYWSIGDKGTHVKSKEGKLWSAPDQGAVLRSYPDGSGFEIFARGLRNPQEIAFDKYGNLFSVDNDSDQKGERERFVHITEGSDTGWRNYYQYRKSDYNPWMEENMWQPEGPDQPAYITPTTRNYSDGPAGFAYNPGTALNDKYKDAFFVTEFPKGETRSFKLKPRGATFEITDDHLVLAGPMNVGINFGPDGALYTADWSGQYPLNEKGAVWKLDDPASAASPIRREVASMLRQGTLDVSTTDLVARLAHPDMRVRLDAQWELVKRNAIPELDATALSGESEQLAIIHALWGLSQAGSFSQKAFHKISKSEDAELRAQAAKHAGEASQAPVPSLVPMLADPNARVRFQAATAIWKLGMADALPAVITMLAGNDDTDAYLRHAGVLAMTTATPDAIAAATLTHPSSAVRLAASIAFRRLSSPVAGKLLEDSDPRVVAEAARAIFDSPPIISAYPALAALIASNPDATTPAIRRSIAANRTLADAASAARLVKYATGNSSPTLRAAAIEALGTWPDPIDLNLVDGRYEPLPAADPRVALEVFSPVATTLGHSDNPMISDAAANTAGKLGIIPDPAGLANDVADPKVAPTARIRALAALKTANLSAYNEIMPALLEDTVPALRLHAAGLLSKSNPGSVLKYASTTLSTSGDPSEKQGIITLLGKMKSPAAPKLLDEIFAQALKAPETPEGLYDPAFLLELFEALPREKVRQLRPLLAKSSPIGKYFISHSGGDPALGEMVFNENLAAQCVACHRIGGEGSEVGPPLTDIGKKGRDYIFESLVAPQAKIAPGYGLMTIVLNDGTALAGALKEESPDSITLILPDKTESTVKTSEIASRTDPISTMPPMGDILNPRELRDLIAWLLTLQ